MEGENLLQHYTLLRSTTEITDRFRRNPLGKTCRFCSKGFPEVSFETKPHIIPELFGHNEMTSNFECDTCNFKFQELESDVSNMTQHFLAMLKIRTKKGVPVFQSHKRKRERSTYLKSGDNHVHLDFGNNLSDFKFDEAGKTLTVKFRTKKFRPFSVYKVFLKMGISVLSVDELKENNHFLEFLWMDEPIKNGIQHWTAYRYILKSKMHKIPTVNLYKANATLRDGVVYPEYMVAINFSTVIFQFILPISIKNIREFNTESQLRIELLPSFLLDDLRGLKTIEMGKFDLSELDKVSVTDTVVFHYDRLNTQR